MKEHGFFLSSILVGVSFFFSISCQKECDDRRINEVGQENNAFVQKSIVISAFSADALDGTRTSFEMESGHILWTPADQISLFFGSGINGGSCFTATNAVPNQRTQFTGTINVITGITEGFDDYYFWGIYPFNSQNSSDGSTVTTVVPSNQTGKAESFQDGEFVSIGKSAGLVMGFYNLCGAFYIKVTRNDITKITLRGNGGENLAGQVKVNMNSGTPAVSEVLNGETEITLTLPNGAAFSPNVGYFLACLPTHFSNGFSFEMETSDGLCAIKEYNIDFTLGRNRFQPFNATIDSEVSFVTTSQPNNEIWYTTDNGSIYPVSNWDGFISNTYSNGKGVIVFENDILEIPSGQFDNMGSGKPYIRSISLPASVQIIRTRAFLEQNITELTIPQGCTCEEGAFGYLPSLQRIIGDNATEDGRFLIEDNTIILYAGSGVSSLSENDFPTDVTKIGKRAFSGLLSLTSVTIPYYITELGEEAFNLCMNLANIVFSDQIRTIPSYCFWGGRITSIEFPPFLERIEDGAWNADGITSLQLSNVTIPSTVTYIGTNVTFAGREQNMVVRVLAQIPPTLMEANAFGKHAVTDMGGFTLFDGTRILVPKSSISLYKADANWSNYWIEEDYGQFF